MRIRMPIACQTVAGVLSLALSGHALALDLHVAVHGNDTNPGTETKPLATLAAARDAARKAAGKEPVTVHVGVAAWKIPSR